MNRLLSYLHEPKTKIGWVHGILACMGALCLSFFMMLVLTYFIEADHTIKMLPAMISTPILMCMIGIWLLFSSSLFICIKKILYTSGFLLTLLLIQGLL